MTTADELRALAERVQALDGPDREVDAEIAVALRIGKNLPDWAINWAEEWRPTIEGFVVLIHSDGRPGPHFSSLSLTASLDAAMTLVPDGCTWQVSTQEPGPWAWVGNDIIDPRAPMAATPALALTAAALLARAEQE